MKTGFYCLLIFVIFYLPLSSLAASSEQLNIAMILWRGETSAEEGFKAGMKEFGYSVNYTHNTLFI